MTLFDFTQVIVTAGAVTVGIVCLVTRRYMLAVINGVVILVQIGLFMVRHG